mgnify:CR=1 FL=1
MAMAVGGAFMLLALMRGLPQILGSETLLGVSISASLLVAWDLSALVFVLLALAAQHVALWILFCTWLCGAAVVSALCLARWLPAPAGVGARSRLRLAPVALWRSSALVLAVANMASFLPIQVWYMGTLTARMSWVAAGDSAQEARLVRVFNWLLPCMAPVLPLFFSLLRRYTLQALPVRFVVCAGMTAAVVALACVGHEAAEYVGFVIFVPWRLLCFLVLCDSVVDGGLAAYFGQFMGLCFFTAGVVSFSTSSIEHALV